MKKAPLAKIGSVTRAYSLASGRSCLLVIVVATTHSGAKMSSHSRGSIIHPHFRRIPLLLCAVQGLPSLHKWEDFVLMIPYHPDLSTLCLAPPCRSKAIINVNPGHVQTLYRLPQVSTFQPNPDVSAKFSSSPILCRSRVTAPPKTFASGLCSWIS